MEGRFDLLIWERSPMTCEVALLVMVGGVFVGAVMGGGIGVVVLGRVGMVIIGRVGESAPMNGVERLGRQIVGLKREGSMRGISGDSMGGVLEELG